jgi:hypothetical protein
LLPLADSCAEPLRQIEPAPQALGDYETFGFGGGAMRKIG